MLSHRLYKSHRLHRLHRFFFHKTACTNALWIIPTISWSNLKICAICVICAICIICAITTSCDSSVKKTTAENDILLQDTILIEVEELKEPEIIIDSRMTFEEAISGTKAPQEIIDQLVLINVEYYSTDHQLHRGQLLLNRSIEKDIIAIFDSIKTWRFPVVQAIPIVTFDWDDDCSMAANNTSSFCYRKVQGSKNLSHHAEGKAIDINPLFNPMMGKSPDRSNRVKPQDARYDKEVPGTLYPGHPVVQEFLKRKFVWGYNFSKYYDIHHFQKTK